MLCTIKSVLWDDGRQHVLSEKYPKLRSFPYINTTHLNASCQGLINLKSQGELRELIDAVEHPLIISKDDEGSIVIQIYDDYVE